MQDGPVPEIEESKLLNAITILISRDTHELPGMTQKLARGPFNSVLICLNMKQQNGCQSSVGLRETQKVSV
jgi:hypothetical protein